MMKELIDDIIRDAIKKANKLGWISSIGRRAPSIQIADVEKTIYGIFDESYIQNLLKIKEEKI